MKYLITIIVFLIFINLNKSMAQNDVKPKYEMKSYYMVFLKKGPNRGTGDSLQTQEIQNGHMSHINKMAEDGKLVLAGPFLDDGDVRGIFILNVETLEEAKELVEKDPAVIAGRLTMEIRPWYGPKVLEEVVKPK